MNAKNFHVSIKDLHICAINPVLEDCYPKSKLGISAHVHKKLPRLY